MGFNIGFGFEGRERVVVGLMTPSAPTKSTGTFSVFVLPHANCRTIKERMEFIPCLGFKYEEERNKSVLGTLTLLKALRIYGGLIEKRLSVDYITGKGTEYPDFKPLKELKKISTQLLYEVGCKEGKEKEKIEIGTFYNQKFECTIKKASLAETKIEDVIFELIRTETRIPLVLHFPTVLEVEGEVLGILALGWILTYLHLSGDWEKDIVKGAGYIDEFDAGYIVVQMEKKDYYEMCTNITSRHLIGHRRSILTVLETSLISRGESEESPF